jgi:heat shock protein HtpX
VAIGSIGLKTHIWNNHLASIFLLICYPLLICVLVYLGCVTYAHMELSPHMVPSRSIWQRGFDTTMIAAPYIFIAVGLWYSIATLFHQHIINSVTHAALTTRFQEPRLYALLEPLCISRGLVIPSLAVIESPALNAFASGLSPQSAQITVTRGMLNTLNDAQLEAVLAHELSHIINHDIKLLIICAVFVGIFAFISEFSLRSLGSGDNSNEGKWIVIIAVISSIGYLLSILLRFTLSRRREYMADAGAVELTKNPDAMVSALEAIAGRSELSHVPSDFQEMMIDYPRTGFFGLFSTHPPIEHRIAVLRDVAGASANNAALIASRIKPQRSPWENKGNLW